MKIYENVYNFEVIDKISDGEPVYVADRSRCKTQNAIRLANSMRMSELLPIINYENKDNRYEFYKVVEVNE